MKFDIAILNPPYNSRSIHFTVIKKMKPVSNRMVIIIPSKEGGIPISLFGCDSRLFNLKIYSFNTNEKLKIEKFTKFPQSEFYIHVPKWAMGLKKFFDTGEYGYKTKNNKLDYYTFSFHTKKDLELFKKRLYEKNSLIRRGSIRPIYERLLAGIDYIKAYREI